MGCHWQQFAVPYEYPVHFTENAFLPGNPTFLAALSYRQAHARHRVLFFVDRGVAAHTPGLCDAITGYAQHHRDRIDLVRAPLLVDGGEAVKNHAGATERVLAALDEHGMDRHAFVIIIGGGAVQDAVGYAAAIAHRGIRVIRLPTTVLSQGDAGVGVKNGVNCFGKKNFLGTFAPPWAVVNDARFLDTLGRRDTIAGMAEAVKVALVRDPGFFDWIRSHAAELAACAPEALASLVRRSAVLHLEHIATSGDPFERGSARPLDFGHWAAHKLESLTGHGLRHGEAVAIGMAIDTLYATRIGLLHTGGATPVLGVLQRLGLRLWDEALELVHPDGRRVVLDGLREFREHLGGALCITLPARIGLGVEVHEIDERAMHGAIDELRRLHARTEARTENNGPSTR